MSNYTDCELFLLPLAAKTERWHQPSGFDLWHLWQCVRASWNGACPPQMPRPSCLHTPPTRMSCVTKIEHRCRRQAQFWFCNCNCVRPQQLCVCVSVCVYVS